MMSKALPFKYQSGQEIKRGDRVLFHGEPGHVEFIADPTQRNEETDWFVQEYGGGVMVIEPKFFGRAFLTRTEDAEDLILVSRLDDSVPTG
jgi:hypothetical protein